MISKNGRGRNRHVTIFELLHLWPSYAGVVSWHQTDYVGVLSIVFIAT